MPNYRVEYPCLGPPRFVYDVAYVYPPLVTNANVDVTALKPESHLWILPKEGIPSAELGKMSGNTNGSWSCASSTYSNDSNDSNESLAKKKTINHKNVTIPAKDGKNQQNPGNRCDRKGPISADPMDLLLAGAAWVELQSWADLRNKYLSPSNTGVSLNLNDLISPSIWDEIVSRYAPNHPFTNNLALKP